MNDEYIRPSSNGYEFLEGYLTQLYVERGSFRHNLEHYLARVEF